MVAKRAEAISRAGAGTDEEPGPWIFTKNCLSDYMGD